MRFSNYLPHRSETITHQNRLHSASSYDAGALIEPSGAGDIL